MTLAADLAYLRSVLHDDAAVMALNRLEQRLREQAKDKPK